MTAASVAFNGTRVNSADSSTSWSNMGGGGPSPAAEPQLKYQGSNAVNRKVTSTSARQGIQFDPGSGAVDMTQAANRLWFVKANVADFGDLNSTWGCELRVGSSSSAYYAYNVAGSGANRSIFNTYPDQGGYLILALDPNIAAWRESTIGSPNLSAVDYFGFGAQFVAGGAKSENVALDAIDIGTGLTITNGTSPDPAGTFQDFASADQGTNGSRWGVMQSKFGALVATGMLTIGSATATVFDDQDSIVVFPDGYHSAGLVGVAVDLQSASTSVDIGSTLIGRGDSATEDTRPDFVVTGTGGALTLSGTLVNHRHVTLTSACTVYGATIQCQLLTQGSADISDSVIETDSAANVACLQDPTFGTSTDLHDCEFVQAGSGHAIELDTATTYTLTGLTFTGYGATGQADAAIHVSATSGTVTINWSGGTAPTYRSDGATVNVVNTVAVTITVKDAVTIAAIQNARVYLEADTGGDLTPGTEIINELTTASGVADDPAFSFTNPQPVTGRARRGTASPFYKTAPISGTITASGLDLTIFMVSDE